VEGGELRTERQRSTSQGGEQSGAERCSRRKPKDDEAVSVTSRVIVRQAADAGSKNDDLWLQARAR